jgi:hypothetical protein
MKSDSPLTERNWPKRRAALSALFDMQSYKVACALLALQSRELVAMQREPAGSISPKELQALAMAARKAQEVGRVALGEVVETSQMTLDLRVIYDDKPAPEDHPD